MAALARSGDIAGATKALASLDELVKASPGDYRSQQFLELARGELAAANGATNAAVAQLEKCTTGQVDELGPYCRSRQVTLLERLGDEPAAAAVGAKVLDKLYADGRYMYLWFKLGGAARRGGA